MLHWSSHNLIIELQSVASMNNNGFFTHLCKSKKKKNHLWLYLPLTDNSISVLAKHDTFRRQKQEMYFLPIIVTDNGNPPMSSTNTLTIRVCGCSKDGIVQSCNVEAYVLPIGLSMGALIAILACIILLLGEVFVFNIVTLLPWNDYTDMQENFYNLSFVNDVILPDWKSSSQSLTSTSLCLSSISSVFFFWQ